MAHPGLEKLPDFGLARLTEAATADDSAAARTVDTNAAPKTAAGTVIRTAACRSREQAQGYEVDARSDIFSFGAVQGIWSIDVRSAE